ncbi:MAG: hypothetical protein ACUVUG_07820 [Candidatus Aminicenantia bacterium]
MVENSYISQIFDDIVFFLKLKSENIYKIRSYEKVRDVILNFGENVEKYWEKGRNLREIEGVGEAIEKKIIEIIETGDCNLHRRLITEFPVSLLELRKLKSLTPQKIKKLYFDYGIKDLNELKIFLNGEGKSILEFKKAREELEEILK